MALKVIEGFDFYAAVTQLTQRVGYLQWTTSNGAVTAFGGSQLMPGRIPGSGQGQALRVDGNYNGAYYSLKGSLATNMQTGFIGFALRLNSATVIVGNVTANTQDCIMDFGDTHSSGGINNSGSQLRVTMHGGDGSIEINGVRSTNNLFPIDTWFFFEIGWNCSHTAGNVTIRVNGAVAYTQTGVNTSPGSVNEWINSIAFMNLFGNSFFIDDLYVCDSAVGAGAYPCNNFLGDRRVITLIPAGPGVDSGFTSSSGVANWQNLGSSDEDVTYNYSGTPGAEDLVTLSALPPNVTAIIAVQVTGRYRKDDAAAHTLTQRVAIGGVDAPGIGFLAPYALSSSYNYYSDIFMVDPSTNANWTVLAIGTVQIGYKLET